YELMQKPGEPGKIRDFSSIEIEISHSPCTACADMLVGLLRDMKAKGTAGLPAKEKFGWKDAAIPAALRWGELFSTPPQAPTGPYLGKLHEEGWQKCQRRAWTRIVRRRSLRTRRLSYYCKSDRRLKHTAAERPQTT